jgi:hypothetical protein
LVDRLVEGVERTVHSRLVKRVELASVAIHRRAASA